MSEFAETGEALDVPNESGPRPLDKITESPSNKNKYPFPYKDSEDAKLSDVPEVPVSYWDHLDGLATSDDEKQFLQTWSAWVDRKARGNDDESKSIREAMVRTIKGETAPENQGGSTLQSMGKDKTGKGHDYPFPYRKGDGEAGSDVLEYPLTYWDNIVPLNINPNEESLLLNFAMYTDRYAGGTGEEAQKLRGGLLKVVEGAMPSPAAQPPTETPPQA